MKGLAQLTAENDALVARAEADREVATRRVWVDGWEDGNKFGRKQGRLAERARIRALIRKYGPADAVKRIMKWGAR